MVGIIQNSQIIYKQNFIQKFITIIKNIIIIIKNVQ